MASGKWVMVPQRSCDGGRRNGGRLVPAHHQTVEATAKWPAIRTIASCTCLRSPDTIDVLTPSWSVRQLRNPSPHQVDLSLPRSLASLQADDGGFDLCPELCAALGLRDSNTVLESAAHDPVIGRLAGALLVLKTAATYRGESWEPPLERICCRAAAHCCQLLNISEIQLWALLEHVEDHTANLQPFPTNAIEALRANFGTQVLWSQSDLWVRLLSQKTQKLLHHKGGVICPRNFLVDLATVTLCPHECSSSYLLYKHEGKLFVGTLAEDHCHHDPLRQGRQLEAAVVSFGWLDEDRVLMELTLPNGMMACYAGAPDALAEDQKVALAPLSPGDETAYAAAGYELGETIESVHGEPRLRIWRAPGRASVASSGYVEVKKTTHLQGRTGEYKRAKYWVQAALAGCGGVFVATTDKSRDGDIATTFQRFGLQELMTTVMNPSAIWLDLTRHLEHVMTLIGDRDGAWTLCLSNHKNAPVTLEVYPGWAGPQNLHETRHIARTVDFLAECNGFDEHCEMGRWEMECSGHWSNWKPEGVHFEGMPGEVVHFKVGAFDYRAVFGPNDGEGFQENVNTGRRRRLRRVNADAAAECRDGDVNATQQLCDMGFPRTEVLRCLQATHGNLSQAVQYLVASTASL